MTPYKRISQNLGISLRDQAWPGGPSWSTFIGYILANGDAGMFLRDIPKDFCTDRPYGMVWINYLNAIARDDLESESRKYLERKIYYHDQELAKFREERIRLNI